MKKLILLNNLKEYSTSKTRSQQRVDEAANPDLEVILWERQVWN